MSTVLVGITLESLRRALDNVEMQAHALALQEREGSTHELADEVRRIAGKLGDDVTVELRARKSWERLEAQS